jgi:hypothetical protein
VGYERFITVENVLSGMEWKLFFVYFFVEKNRVQKPLSGHSSISRSKIPGRNIEKGGKNAPLVSYNSPLSVMTLEKPVTTCCFYTRGMLSIDLLPFRIFENMFFNAIILKRA